MSENTRIIIEALDACGENGSGVISLSLSTGINQESLRTFLTENKSYCLPIEKHKFKLNRNTVENGSVEKIVINIEHEIAERKINKRVSRGFTWGLVLGLLSPYIGKWIFDLYAWLF